MEVISTGRWLFAPIVDEDPAAHLVVNVSEPSENVCRLGVVGDLDLAGSGVLDDTLADVPDGLVLAIDLTDIEFIDCSGIRCLIEVRSRRRVSLVCPSMAVRRLFELAGVEHLLDGS